MWVDPFRVVIGMLKYTAAVRTEWQTWRWLCGAQEHLPIILYTGIHEVIQVPMKGDIGGQGHSWVPIENGAQGVQRLAWLYGDRSRKATDWKSRRLLQWEYWHLGKANGNFHGILPSTNQFKVCYFIDKSIVDFDVIPEVLFNNICDRLNYWASQRAEYRKMGTSREHGSIPSRSWYTDFFRETILFLCLFSQEEGWEDAKVEIIFVFIIFRWVFYHCRHSASLIFPRCFVVNLCEKELH